MGAPESANPYKQRRRSDRVLLAVPVGVSGMNVDGLPFQLHGHTISVNKHGAKLRLNEPVPSSEIVVSVPSSQRSQKARVVYVDEAHEGEIAIELRDSDDNFWGVYFPPSEP